MNKISAVIMFLGTVFFIIGFHMIDNAWNMQADMLDHSIFLAFSKIELYRYGTMTALFGFLISVVSAMFIEKKEPETKVEEKIPMYWQEIN